MERGAVDQLAEIDGSREKVGSGSPPMVGGAGHDHRVPNGLGAWDDL